MNTRWKDFVAFLDETRVKARQHNPKKEVDPEDIILTSLQQAVEQIKAGKFDYRVPDEIAPAVQATTTGIARVKTVEESERPFRGNQEPRMTVQPRESKPEIQRPDLEEVFPEGAHTSTVDDALAATLPAEEEQQ